MSSTEELAIRTLQEVGVFKPPVQLEKIAALKKLQIQELTLADDLSGALVQSDHGSVAIIVNRIHHKNRRRFTIAHELGHFCLGHLQHYQHVDREFTVIPRNQVSSQATDPRERSANAFAACLLMPESFLLRDHVKSGGFKQSDLPLLSRRYQVSEQAMRFRLMTLGLLPPF